MNIAAAIVRGGASAEISVAESVLLSLLGFALVFVVLIVLILVIKLITGATGKIESNAKKAAEAAALAKAVAAEKAAATVKEAAVKEVAAVNTAAITNKAVDATTGTVTATTEIVASPIQGTVFEINVTIGQTIKKGSLLVVIEAMYMENEVLAQREGTVSQIICKVGENVNVAAPLIVLI